MIQRRKLGKTDASIDAIIATHYDYEIVLEQFLLMDSATKPNRNPDHEIDAARLQGGNKFIAASIHDPQAAVGSFTT